MRIAIVGLMVGVLASVACGGLIPDGWLTWTQTDLGGGLTGYTLNVDDGESTGSWACELTFTGVGSALINQVQAFGSIVVDEEGDADTYDAIPTASYDKELDSWMYNPWAGIGPSPQFTETSNSWFVRCGTGPGDFAAPNVAYIVSDGFIGWDGVIARGGVDYDTSGQIPEPATLAVLVIGGILMLLRRKR